MEPDEVINTFTKFLEENHLSSINENIRKGNPFVYLKFSDISAFKPELGTQLLDEPEDTLLLFSTGAEQLTDEKIVVRVVGLPDACNIPLWEIRKPTNKFIRFEGYVSRLEDVLLRPHCLIFKCDVCGNTLRSISQDRNAKPKTPKTCGCGGKLFLQDTLTIPTRTIYVEEDIMEMGERQIPRHKIVVMEKDLTLPEIDKQTLVGRKVIVNGWLETFVVSEKRGLLDTQMICNSLEFIERGWQAIDISKKEKERFKKMAKDKDLIKKLSQSIMSTIHGEDKVKYGLLLQLVGANNIYDSKGFLEERGCIHLALIGPPGTGKTYMIKRIRKFWPIYRFASAVTATGRGLIATATYDKVLEKWVLISGIIPTCHKGNCAIDELEKMNKDEYGYLNNAMNDLNVIITKAASGKLETDVSILATMNPRGRVFVPGIPVYEQIDLPADLIDRFDLIFPVRASLAEEDQRKVFKMGLSKRKKKEDIEPIYPEEKLIKYFAYARSLKPKFSNEMEKTVEDRVMKFVKPSSSIEQQISNRIFWVILRLLEASARLHLRGDIIIKDLNDIMELLIYSYKEQGLLDAHNILDYAKIEHIDEHIAHAVPLVKELVAKLEENVKPVPIEDLIAAVEGKVPDDKIDEAIEKLKREGELMEPRRGFIQRVP